MARLRKRNDPNKPVSECRRSVEVSNLSGDIDNWEKAREEPPYLKSRPVSPEDLSEFMVSLLATTKELKTKVADLILALGERENVEYVGVSSPKISPHPEGSARRRGLARQ